MSMTGTSTTGGSFPQSSTDLSALIGAQGFPVSLPSVTEFFAQNGITNATTQASFLELDANGDPVKVNGKEQLNLYAYEYQQLKSMPEEDRQQVQDAMVTAGFMTDTNATGKWDAATASALADAQSAATDQGSSDVVPYLQANSGPEATVQNQIVSNATAAEKADLAAEQPRVANLTDTNSLNQTLSKAFEDALGYTPSAQQMNTFAQSFHAAQTSEVAGENEALKTAAQQEITNATSEESALNKLGPNGLKALVDAYANAIHGVNPQAGAGQQGPVTGNAPTGPNASQYIAPGSKLPPDTTAGFNSSGAEMLANTVATGGRAAVPAQPAGNAISDLMHGRIDLWGTSQGTTGRPAIAATPTPGMATAPNLPVGLKGSSPTYGGFYALSPAIWQEVAKAANVDLKKYPTAGSAPLPLQQSAFYKWVQDESDAGVSNSNIVLMAASGQTTAPSKNTSTTPVLGKTGTNLQSFSTGIVNNVNSQLEAIYNQASQPAVPVIGKIAPNAEADALAATEAADPNQFIAHNMSLAEGTVQKMLYGTPDIEAQSSSNLAADVAQVTASNSGAA